MLIFLVGRYKWVEGIDEFVVIRCDYFMFVVCGYIDEFILRIVKDGNIVEWRDEYGWILFYIVSKLGFYDICSLFF